MLPRGSRTSCMILYKYTNSAWFHFDPIMYQVDFFSGIPLLFHPDRGSFVVLSAAGHAGGTSVRTAQVWAGRGPWRVLSGFKVTNSDK